MGAPRLLVLALLGATFSPRMARGADIANLIAQLSDDDRAEAAVQELVQAKEAAVPTLVRAIGVSSDMTVRGWAVVALSQIPGPGVDAELERLHTDTANPALVRTWAAAARVRRARDSGELIRLSRLQRELPSLQRPLRLRFEQLLRADGKATTEELIAMAVEAPQLMMMVVDPVLATGAPELVAVMASAADANVRRQAAAYLATLAQRQGPQQVAEAVAQAYGFDRRVGSVPWEGGPLFVPGIQWPKAEATSVVRSLVAWHLWCDVRGMRDVQKQIHNNIRSLQLARVVGYQSPGWSEISTVQWLQIWGQLAGRDEVVEMLRAQGLDAQGPYARALDGL